MSYKIEIKKEDGKNYISNFDYEVKKSLNNKEEERRKKRL